MKPEPLTKEDRVLIDLQGYGNRAFIDLFKVRSAYLWAMEQSKSEEKAKSCYQPESKEWAGGFEEGMQVMRMILKEAFEAVSEE